MWPKSSHQATTRSFVVQFISSQPKHLFTTSQLIQIAEKMNTYYLNPQELPEQQQDLAYNEEELKQIIHHLVSDWQKLSINH